MSTAEARVEGGAHADAAHAWVGRSEERADTITTVPACLLADTLDRDLGLFADGTRLPPLWHWLYFLPRTRQGEIGADGHARRGGFLPPVALPRRMWAGGRLTWEPDNPLRIGEPVRRASLIRSVAHKTGRAGELAFVVVEHTLSNSRGQALTEVHDIVYRAARRPGEVDRCIAAPTLAAGEGWSRRVVPDDVLLFRYSALTFNGHRIHYDRRYVTEVEGYPGLIVHGPLIATLLVDLVTRQLPDAASRIQAFEFRAVRPLFDLHAFTVSGRPRPDGRVELWASDHEGWLCMTATVTLAAADAGDVR